MVHLNESERRTNFTNQTSYNPFFCSYSLNYVHFTFLMIALIISMAGNVFVVAIFYRNKAFRTNIDYFMISMAVSDVLIQWAYVSPFVSGLLHKDNRWLVNGILGSALCKLTFYSWQVSRFVSLLSILVTAAERFRGIVFPFKPALINQNRCPFVITVTWIVSMVVPAHFLYGVRLVSYDTKSYCVFHWDPPVYTADVARISFLLFFCTTVASAIILTVLYSKIVIHLYKENKTLHLAPEVIKARANTNRQITTMLVLVVVAFYTFWSPFAVSGLKWTLNPEKKLQCNSTGLAAHLVYPIVNPLIYYVFNKKYRHGFRELLCCCCNKNSPATVTPLKDKNVQPRGTGQVTPLNDKNVHPRGNVQVTPLNDKTVYPGGTDQVTPLNDKNVQPRGTGQVTQLNDKKVQPRGTGQANKRVENNEAIDSPL